MTSETKVTNVRICEAFNHMLHCRLNNKDNMAASVLALPSRLWEPAHWLSHSTMMAASVLAHTHFNYDGSQRAGFAIWTMAASVLAYPLQL